MKIVTTSGNQLNSPDGTATPDDAINLDRLIAQVGQALEEWRAGRTVTPAEGQAPRPPKPKRSPRPAAPAMKRRKITFKAERLQPPMTVKDRRTRLSRP